MSRYSRLLERKESRKNKQKLPNQISIFDKQVDSRLVTDPRPDLVDDHHLWGDLLYLAAQKDEMLAGILHGFRCMGTRIRKNREGRYVLRPDIDSDGNRAWESYDQYAEARERWLKEYRNVLIELLGQLHDEYGQEAVG